MEFKEPVVRSLADGLYFNFSDIKLTVSVTRIRSDRDTVSCEVQFDNFAPVLPPVLFTGKFNCLSLETRQRLANYLEKRRDNLPWHDILELIAQRVTQTARASNPIKTISSNDELVKVDFDVYPFIQVNQPTTLYGDGGTGKSYIALIMAIAIRLPWWDNPLSLRTKRDSKDVLWLDFETCEADFQRRLNRLINGMKLGEVSIDYRACNQVLADEIDELSVIANMRQYGLVVIDSIGAACAGDLHGAEAPTRFFNAIRQLPGSKLLIFHINKEKELYGNRFFWNFTRHAWEVKKQQAEGDDTISVGLYHRKANETKLFSPVAYNLLFDDLTTVVEKAEIAEVPELARNISLKDQIAHVIKHSPEGKLRIKDLCDELPESNESSVKSALHRYKDRRFVKLNDNYWGLKSHESVA